MKSKTDFKNQYQDYEHDVVHFIHSLSIGALTLFQNEFPELQDIISKSKRPSNDWRFYLTAAGIVVVKITLKSDQKQIKKLMDTAIDIDKQLPEAVNNFDSFIGGYDDVGIDLFSKLGVWVLWNIAGECPSHKEMERLAPAIGSYLKNLVNEFVNSE